VGIGADELIKQGFFGPRRVNPSRDLDEPTLIEIAKSTGGDYFRARNLEELDRIYALLDDLEEIEVQQQMIRPEKSLFHYPLGLALFLAGLIFALQQGWFSALTLAKLSTKEKANV